MSDGPPEALRRQLPHDPKLWVRNFLRHPNRPGDNYDFYDTSGEDFLYYLADDNGPMNPEKWGDINVLLFCRGGLKTFTVSSIASWATDCYPSLEVDITAPVDDQREEVIERYRTKVEQSGMDARMEKNSMRHMKFKNYTTDDETGEKYPSYSHMKSRTAWDEGNKLRGLHGHMGIIDESQDVDEGTFSTFLEAIDREVPEVDYFPTIFVIGTPKLAGSFFNRLWQMSDQKSWSEEDKEWIEGQDAEEFLPESLQRKKEELAEEIEEIEEQIEACDDDDDRDDLVELRDELRDEFNDIEGFSVKGWHLDQHNCPLHDNTRVAYKKETYSTKKFENEVKANFYTPDNDLITSSDVWDAFMEERRFSSSQRYPSTTTVLGLDWGGGQGEGAASTVCVVAEETPDDGDDLEVCKIDVFDNSLSSREERDKIDMYMNDYSVDIAVVDEGFGDTDREELQNEYGYDDSGSQRLYGCYFGSVKNKEELKWNRFNEAKQFFTTNKSYMVKQMAEDFKDQKIRIPSDSLSFDTKNSKGTTVVNQLTAPYTDRKEVGDGKKKVKVESDRHDDIFDAFVYAWIAANKVQSTRSLKQIGSHDRPGYT